MIQTIGTRDVLRIRGLIGAWFAVLTLSALAVAACGGSPEDAADDDPSSLERTVDGGAVDTGSSRRALPEPSTEENNPDEDFLDARIWDIVDDPVRFAAIAAIALLGWKLLVRPSDKIKPSSSWSWLLLLVAIAIAISPRLLLRAIYGLLWVVGYMIDWVFSQF